MILIPKHLEYEEIYPNILAFYFYPTNEIEKNKLELCVKVCEFQLYNSINYYKNEFMLEFPPYCTVLCESFPLLLQIQFNDNKYVDNIKKLCIDIIKKLTLGCLNLKDEKLHKLRLETYYLNTLYDYNMNEGEK